MQSDEKMRKQNQLKMMKELQIVNSIKNKEYLIKYYYENKPSGIDYVLM